MQSALLDAEIKGRASLEQISQQFAGAAAHFHPQEERPSERSSGRDCIYF